VIRAFVAQVRPEQLEAYCRLHAEPWPEITALLLAANLRDYQIFIDPVRHLLFARWTYVGDDFTGDMAKLRTDATAQRWHEQTLACLIPVGDGTDAWVEIESIFTL
jgi:L-rhamnose mutarotase